MGTSIPKQYMNLAGKPVLAHTLIAFDEVPIIDEIVVVASSRDFDYIENEIVLKYSIKKPVHYIEGGKERQDSVYNALKALQNEETFITAIHDGARPLITREIIEKTIDDAMEFGSAVAGVPVKDTIKRVDKNGFSIDTPDRSELIIVQTPQTFKYDLILEAHERAASESYYATDDTKLVERLGHRVKMTEGSYENIKITTMEDIIFAEGILDKRRNR